MHNAYKNFSRNKMSVREITLRLKSNLTLNFKIFNSPSKNPLTVADVLSDAISELVKEFHINLNSIYLVTPDRSHIIENNDIIEFEERFQNNNGMFGSMIDKIENMSSDMSIMKGIIQQQSSKNEQQSCDMLNMKGLIEQQNSNIEQQTSDMLYMKGLIEQQTSNIKQQTSKIEQQASDMLYMKEVIHHQLEDSQVLLLRLIIQDLNSVFWLEEDKRFKYNKVALNLLQQSKSFRNISFHYLQINISRRVNPFVLTTYMQTGNNTDSPSVLCAKIFTIKQFFSGNYISNNVIQRVNKTLLDRVIDFLNKEVKDNDINRIKRKLNILTEKPIVDICFSELFNKSFPQFKNPVI